MLFSFFASFNEATIPSRVSSGRFISYILNSGSPFSSNNCFLAAALEPIGIPASTRVFSSNITGAASAALFSASISQASFLGSILFIRDTTLLTSDLLRDLTFAPFNSLRILCRPSVVAISNLGLFSASSNLFQTLFSFFSPRLVRRSAFKIGSLASSSIFSWLSCASISSRVRFCISSREGRSIFSSKSVFKSVFSSLSSCCSSIASSFFCPEDLIPPIVAGTIGIKNPAAAALTYSSRACLSFKGRSAPYLSMTVWTTSIGASLSPVIPMFFIVLTSAFVVAVFNLSKAPRPILRAKKSANAWALLSAASLLVLKSLIIFSCSAGSSTSAIASSTARPVTSPAPNLPAIILSPVV